MHYTFIFLIISSNDQDVYLQMKLLSSKYYNLYSNIKYFFVELRNDIIESNMYYFSLRFDT